MPGVPRMPALTAVTMETGLIAQTDRCRAERFQPQIRFANRNDSFGRIGRRGKTIDCSDDACEISSTRFTRSGQRHQTFARQMPGTPIMPLAFNRNQTVILIAVSSLEKPLGVSEWLTMTVPGWSGLNVFLMRSGILCSTTDASSWGGALLRRKMPAHSPRGTSTSEWACVGRNARIGCHYAVHISPDPDCLRLERLPQNGAVIGAAASQRRCHAVFIRADETGNDGNAAAFSIGNRCACVFSVV